MTDNAILFIKLQDKANEELDTLGQITAETANALDAIGDKLNYSEIKDTIAYYSLIKNDLVSTHQHAHESLIAGNKVHMDFLKTQGGRILFNNRIRKERFEDCKKAITESEHMLEIIDFIQSNNVTKVEFHGKLLGKLCTK